jgi:ABC-type polysaccharide/polyol phosphate transport system ATPase subunit
LDVSEAPLAIEVRGLEKTFRVPEHRMDTLKERVTHPFAGGAFRELHAVRGVTFDVHRGEFFGIAGLNGSGKSTLLKILTSIYRADAGRVRIAGRLAPFIELGVGFDPELTARENCELNGVLMGLSRRDARSRLDAVLDFAELREFVELKLKNYSSGMMVRLAFAIMVQADADIMLVDEVLAVGDAGFAQRCMDVFHERRRQGKTNVLVTHDMTTVRTLCDRAMLLDHGQIDYIGDPDETARRYHRLNFSDLHLGDRAAESAQAAMPDINARVLDARLTDEQGNKVERVREGSPIRIEVLLETRQELDAPTFVLQAMNDESVVVFSITRTLDDGREHVAAGERVRIAGTVENRLVPGRYSADCWVRRRIDEGSLAVQGMRLFQFEVEGTAARDGVVSVDAQVEAVTVDREAR